MNRDVFREGDRVLVIPGGPTDIGLRDLRGQTGTVEKLGRKNAVVKLDGIDRPRLIPFDILDLAGPFR